MGVFDEEIQLALDLIEENGQFVVWRKLTNGVDPDPEKPWEPGQATYVDNNVSIVFLPVDREGQESLHYMQNTEIATASLLGLMASVPFEPAEKDIVLRDSKELVIMSIDELSPNGQKILYELRFK
jgi:hypothetical protein